MAGLCATQPVVLSDGRPSALLLPQSSPCGGGANGASASALHRGLCEVLRFSACEVAAAQAQKANEAATAVATATTTTTTTTTTTPTTTPASTILVTADLTKGNMSVQWAVGAPAAAAAAASALATPALLREVSAAFCAAAEQQSSALRCAFEAPAPPPPALPPAEQPSSAHGERRQRLGHALAGISTTVELTTPTHRLTLSSGDANGCIRPVEGGALGVGRVALTLKVLDGLRTGGDGALGWAALKNAAQAVQVEALADRIASDASDAAAAAATPPARARDAPALGMVGRRSYAPSTTTTAAAAAAGGPNIIVEVTGRSPYDLTPTLAPAVTPPKAKPQALAVLDNNALVGGDVRRARRKEGFASGDAVVPEPTLESLCRAVCSPELVEHRPASCGAGAGGVVVPAPAVPIPSGGDGGGGGGAATYRSKLAQTMRYAEGLQLQLGPAATTPPPPPPPPPPQPAQRPPSALGGCDVPPVLSPLACMMRTACCSPASLDASGCERVGDSASVLATAADGLICGVCRDEIAFDGTVSALVYCEACRTYSCHQCVVAHVKAATRRRMLGTPSRGATPEVLSPSSLLSPKFTDGNTLRCPQFGCREVLSEEVVNTVLASYVGVFCGKCKCEVPFDGSVESIPLCEGCGKYCCEACFTTHLTDQILKSSTVSCGIDGCTHAVSQADLRKYLPTELFESVERKTDDELGAAFAGSAGGRRFKCVACKINIEKDSTGLRAELTAMRRRFEREKVAPGGTVSIDHADMTLQAALHYTEHRIRCGCCAATFCSECFATPYHAGQTCEQAAHPLRCRYCDASLLAPQVVRVPSQPAAAVLPAKPAEDNAKDAGANPPQPKPSGSAWWRRRLFSSGNQDKRGGGDGAKSAVIPVQPDASSSASAATAASGGAGAGAGECIVVDVCGSAECRRHFAVACKKVLPCGHNCNGVGCQEAPPALADATAGKEPKDGVGTLVVPPPAKPVTRWGCLPCLKQDCCAFKKRLQEAEEKPSATATPGYVTCQSGSDFCSICWAESLSAAPCIQLPCGHIVHHHCVVEKLQNKWPTLRISFAFLACTLCGDEMRHPSSAISELLKPLLKMRADLSKKWLDRLKLEGLVSVPAITSDTASPYYKAPLKYAEHMLNYYQCSKCDKPYFGGVKRCDDLAGYDEDGNGEVREIQRSELVCGACVDKTSCPKHGTEYIQFKCRYCCRPAVWFCWGTTHFCDKCHRSLPQKLPRCSGPESCPLRLDHPPNGQEFAIGCVACRFDFPAAP